MALKDSKHIIVQKYRPERRRLIIALLVVCLIASWWLLFDYGRSRGGYDSQEAGDERNELLSHIEVMKQENDRLREKNGMLEQAREVDSHAYQELDYTIRSLQNEILQLKEELAFYHGIVGSSGELKGLQIQNLKLEKNSDLNSYHFKIILTQFIKGTRQITGKVRLSVTGMQEGKHKDLQHEQVSINAANGMKFKFKHFQVLEGDILLPEGFVPISVKLTATPYGSTQPPKERIFSWQV